jgi:hypothetical protein
MVSADIRMSLPRLTDSSSIAKVLNKIRDAIVSLTIQQTPTIRPVTTSRGTFINLPTQKDAGASAPVYTPFITEGETTYFITPWHFGLCGPEISVGGRQYRGFQLTDGDKVLLATVKVRASATRYPQGTQDLEHPEVPPTGYYSVLTEVMLANQEATSFSTDQVGFTSASFTGHTIITTDFGGATQYWFFPVRLESEWDEQSSRISSDEVVANGEPVYTPPPEEEENPWDPKFYTLETSRDIVVAFLKQSAPSEPHTLAGMSQQNLQGIGPVPDDTQIVGAFGGDQRFPFWHSEVQVVPVYSVSKCPPEEGTVPWEPYGFNLTNRDSFGYEPGSDFPGRDNDHLLRNDYPRQVAFMLPFGILMQSSGMPTHTIGEMALNDTRELPPSCL